MPKLISGSVRWRVSTGKVTLYIKQPIGKNPLDTQQIFQPGYTIEQDNVEMRPRCYGLKGTMTGEPVPAWITLA